MNEKLQIMKEMGNLAESIKKMENDLVIRRVSKIT